MIVNYVNSLLRDYCAEKDQRRCTCNLQVVTSRPSSKALNQFEMVLNNLTF